MTAWFYHSEAALLKWPPTRGGLVAKQAHDSGRKKQLQREKAKKAAGKGKRGDKGGKGGKGGRRS